MVVIRSSQLNNAEQAPYDLADAAEHHICKAQFARSPYVTRDPRLDKLVDKQIELNKEALKNRTILEPGYRIVVISTNKRDLALEAKGN